VIDGPERETLADSRAQVLRPCAILADQKSPIAVQTAPDPGVRDQSAEITAVRAPVPPYTRETARQKVRLAEDGWNSRDPEKVALAYTRDSRWRNRAEFVNGRREIVAFLTRKWAKELDYRSGPRAPRTTLAPRSASKSAVASPIPLLAP
jgi:hypothetical protein